MSDRASGGSAAVESAHRQTAFLAGFVKELRANGPAYALVLPSVLLVGLVAIYPILYAFRLSLFETVLFAPTRFVGAAHYWALLGDAAIRRNLVASLQFTGGSIILSVALGLALAVLLNQRLRLRTTVRVIIFIPWVTSQITSGLIWRWLVNPDYGPVVSLLRETVGTPRIDLLSDVRLAMVALVLTNVWRSAAFSMIIFLAALQGIPESVVRAAAVDGASTWRAFKDVTIPLIAPSIVVCIIISSLGYLNNITVPLILTGGGPMDATEVLSLRLYREAFSYFHVGYASAIAILILALNVALTLGYIKIARARGYE